MRTTDWRAILGRELRRFDLDALRPRLAEARVLVTGGGGWIGRRVVRRLLDLGAPRVAALDLAESGLVKLQERERPGLLVRLGDAADQESLGRLIGDEGLDLIVHAAAYKHVPLAEENPRAALLDNVGSALAVSRAARAHGARRLLLLSSDKAVAPSGVMGRTKRIAERLLLVPDRRAATARLANVLDSAGSVLPIFRRRLRAGRPLPLTGEEHTRLVLAPSEAVDGLVAALLLGEDGEILAPDPGEPVAVEELARRLAASLGLPEPRFERRRGRPGDRDREQLFHPAESPLEPAAPGLLRRAPPREAALDEDEISAALEEVRRGDDARARAVLARLQASDVSASIR